MMFSIFTIGNGSVRRLGTWRTALHYTRRAARYETKCLAASVWSSPGALEPWSPYPKSTDLNNVKTNNENTPKLLHVKCFNFHLFEEFARYLLDLIVSNILRFLKCP